MRCFADESTTFNEDSGDIVMPVRFLPLTTDEARYQTGEPDVDGQAPEKQTSLVQSATP